MSASASHPRAPGPARSLGDLQAQLMPALWRLGEGTVDDVREALPLRYEGAYTTVQTVLNRLAHRGLLTRERRGQTILYRPVVSEADYITRIIEDALAGASHDARRTVLDRLVTERGGEGRSDPRGPNPGD